MITYNGLSRERLCVTDYTYSFITQSWRRDNNTMGSRLHIDTQVELVAHIYMATSQRSKGHGHVHGHTVPQIFQGHSKAIL